MSRAKRLDRAVEHHRAGRLDEAAALYRAILRDEPDLATAHAHLGDVRRRQGRWEDARASLERALTLDPRSSAFQAQVVELAEALLGNGQLDEALALCRRIAALVPRSAPIRRTLADALHARGDRPGAIAAYREAVALDPSDLAAYWGMGCAQDALSEWADAAESFGRAVALRPEFGEARYNLGKALFELGRIDGSIAAYREAAAVLPSAEMPLGMIATIIPGSPAADHQAVLDARRAWAARITPSGPSEPATVPDRSDRPIRLGYVSSFFGRRNWMKPVWALIGRHDRDRFEVHLFSDGPEPGLESGYRPHPGDRFHDISGQGNADVARLVRSEAIDILVDLNGYSKLPRLPLFAARPAPVLVAWFNQFATSGLGVFDALIGDAHVIKPGEEPHYTEPIVRIPGSYLTFDVAYPVPGVVEPPCLARGPLTFGSMAPQYKITPEVVSAWARILRESPGTRLFLKSVALASGRNRGFVLDQFARHAIAPERLELEGPDEHHAFLSRYAAIDLSLDTFPYNGGTSTMESLWQGVPVLTFDGDRWASRTSASLIREAGLPEFVAPDLDGYASLAVSIANDPETPGRLAALRRTLRDRLRRASVCDSQRFARDMEAIYRRLWDRWRASSS